MRPAFGLLHKVLPVIPVHEVHVYDIEKRTQQAHEHTKNHEKGNFLSNSNKVAICYILSLSFGVSTVPPDPPPLPLHRYSLVPDPVCL